MKLRRDRREIVDDCLVCGEVNGAVEVPGGLIEDGLVATFHRPPLDDPLVYAGYLFICPTRHPLIGTSARSAEWSRLCPTCCAQRRRGVRRE